MATNPLDDDPEREQRIRHKAYHLWVDEGRPPNLAHAFWERASALIGMEDSAGFGQLPNPIAVGSDPSQTTIVEEASIQDNLGEVPGPLTDQAEVRSTPVARRTASGAVKPEKPATRPAKKLAEAAPETLPAKPSLKAKLIGSDTADRPKAGKSKA